MFVVYELFIYVLHVIYTFRTLLCIFETFVDVKLQLKLTSLSVFLKSVKHWLCFLFFLRSSWNWNIIFYNFKKKNNLYT